MLLFLFYLIFSFVFLLIFSFVFIFPFFIRLRSSVILARLEEAYEKQDFFLRASPDLIGEHFYSKWYMIYIVRDQIITFLHLRFELNNENELLDRCPDIFWDEPELETNFQQISRHLDINYRVVTLNKRLGFYADCITWVKVFTFGEYSLRLDRIIIQMLAISNFLAFLDTKCLDIFKHLLTIEF